MKIVSNTEPLNVLFLCTGNSARSIMAEAILNRLGRGKFRAFSAGSQPAGYVHPLALQMLRNAHYDVSNVRSKPWDEFARPDAPNLDFVFTVCDNAAKEVCPVWPGQPMTAHWGLPDPAKAEGTDAEKAAAFADTMRMLNQRIGIFVSLPLDKLSKLTLQKHLDDIGKVKAEIEGLVTVGISRRLVAETVGTAFLLAAIVGSGIMADRLAGGNVAVALLCNSLATGTMLYVLITVLAPISGAYLNPAVTLAFVVSGSIGTATASAYVVCQIIGAVLGTWIAHAMFEVPILEVSATARAAPGLWLAEAVATFGLVLTILGALRWEPEAIPAAVGLYIVSAYWFTASTSFANPAVTVARSLTDTFSGIHPASVPAFILAQLAGAGVASVFCRWLFSNALMQEAKK